jgi:hypothetical protein
MPDDVVTHSWAGRPFDIGIADLADVIVSTADLQQLRIEILYWDSQELKLFSASWSRMNKQKLKPPP